MPGILLGALPPATSVHPQWLQEMGTVTLSISQRRRLRFTAGLEHSTEQIQGSLTSLCPQPS